jgi:hypothetical protein
LCFFLTCVVLLFGWMVAFGCGGFASFISRHCWGCGLLFR